MNLEVDLSLRHQYAYKGFQKQLGWHRIHVSVESNEEKKCGRWRLDMVYQISEHIFINIFLDSEGPVAAK